MFYQKPQLVPMGSAVEVIQSDNSKTDMSDPDSQHGLTDPAYQADE